MIYVPGGYAVFVLSSIEVISLPAFKIARVCSTKRLVLCFQCSAWASLFYGFTADGILELL